MATGWRGLGIGLAGLAGFLLVAYVVLKQAPDWFAETDTVEARQGVRTASLALLAGTIGVIGAVYTARTFALNRAGQITDRFTKAIEQLGHEQLDVRLGGIYALERIAKDSREDHPQVVEVLTAYVREHAARSPSIGRNQVPPAPEKRPDRPTTDVQAALTVLGRRTIGHEQHAPLVLDLSFTELANMNLQGANFSGANLSGTNLSYAQLDHANFAGALLPVANLSNASLKGANLSGATMPGADLSNAALFDTNLSAASMVRANLESALMSGSNLEDAALAGASLHGASVDQASLHGAVYNDETRWPAGFELQKPAEERSTEGGENPEPRT